MADFSLTITVSDADVQTLVDAINWHNGADPDNPNNLPKTAAQCRTWFKERSIAALKDIVKRHREYLRSQQAIAVGPTIT